MDITSLGQVLFSGRSKHKLVFNDFTITRDSIDKYAISWRDVKYPVAYHKGTFAEATRALKVQLVTSRLSS